MNRAVVILLHAGYWLLYLLLATAMILAMSMQIGRTTPVGNAFAALPLVSLLVLPNVVSFYSLYFSGFTRFLSRGKLFGLIVFATGVCAVSASAGILISLGFFGISQPIFSDAREFLPLFATFFFIAAIHGGIALVVRGFVKWFDEVKLKEELMRRNFETESALVKSQMNPHFLFNTINNIDVLIAKDANRASSYLNKLSEILRYVLYDAGAEKISLSDELDCIGRYVELEKIRTARSDFVNFEVTGEVNGRKIAPMILFPFIENAFKHSSGNRHQNQIRIKTSIRDRTIDFECINTYQKRLGTENNNHSGLGLEVTKRRLELLYPSKHLLEISDCDGVYKVKLSINED